MAHRFVPSAWIGKLTSCSMRLVLFSLLCCLLSSCTKMNFEFGWAKPTSLLMKKAPPGPPLYQQAYRDGCETGYKAYSNSFNKLFHEWKQDPHLAQKKMYYKMWKDAYAYCSLYGMMTDEHGFGNWW